MRLCNEPKEEYPTLCESECPAIRQRVWAWKSAWQGAEAREPNARCVTQCHRGLSVEEGWQVERR